MFNRLTLILGTELYGHLLRNGIRRGKTHIPIAQNISLGWVVSGPYRWNNETASVSVHNVILEQLDLNIQ